MSQGSSSSSSDEDDDEEELDRRRPQPQPLPPPPPPLCALRAHGGDVQATVLSPCGTLLYSGDSEGDLRVWDVDDRRTVSCFKAHPSEGGVLGLYLSFEQKELLSQGREGTLKLWMLSESGREVVDGGGGEGGGSPGRCSSIPPPRPLRTTDTFSKGFCVLSAVESSEGKLLAAVASEDAAGVRVFDARSGELLCELGEDEAAAAAAVGGAKRKKNKKKSSGGGSGAGGTEKEEGEGEEEQPKSRGMAMAVSLFFFPTRRDSPRFLHALVGYEDGSVVLWRCLGVVGGGGGERSDDGDGDDGDDVRATAAAAAPPRALSSLRVHFDAVTALAVGSSCLPLLRFFSGGADSVLASYFVEEEEGGEEEGEEETAPPSLSLRSGPAVKLPARGVGALAVFRKEAAEEETMTLVVVGGWDGAIRLLALRETPREKEESEEGESGNEEEKNDDDSFEAAASLEPVGELEHHVAPVASLAFDASGDLMASGGRDGSVALWGGFGM